VCVCVCVCVLSCRGLADTKQVGKLTREQFSLAMYIIQQKVSQGLDPPQSLTPDMIPPSERSVPTAAGRCDIKKKFTTRTRVEFVATRTGIECVAAERFGARRLTLGARPACPALRRLGRCTTDRRQSPDGNAPCVAPRTRGRGGSPCSAAARCACVASTPPIGTHRRRRRPRP